MFVCVQLLKSFPTLCDPMDCVAWPGSSVHGGFSRQEYWSGLPFPSPGDLPNPGIEPGSPTLQADTLPSEPPGKSTHIFLRLTSSVLLGKLLSMYVRLGTAAGTSCHEET